MKRNIKKDFLDTLAIYSGHLDHINNMLNYFCESMSVEEWENFVKNNPWASAFDDYSSTSEGYTEISSSILQFIFEYGNIDGTFAIEIIL